jgi:hypothetical protein
LVIAKKGMLGSDSGIISLLPSLAKPKMLQLCKSHQPEKYSYEIFTLISKK